MYFFPNKHLRDIVGFVYRDPPQFWFSVCSLSYKKLYYLKLSTVKNPIARLVQFLNEHNKLRQWNTNDEAKGKRVLSVRYKQHTPLLSQRISIGTVRDTHDEARATLHCHGMVTVNNIGKQFHIAESSVNLCVRYKQHTPLRQIMDQDHAAFDMLNFKTGTERCSV